MDSRQSEQSDLLIHSLEGLELKKEKGHGAYGAVYEVILNGLPCIAKGLHDILVNNLVAETKQPIVRAKFFSECLSLSKLKHPNIVQSFGVYQTKEDAFLVMEYMDMALDVCLKENPDIPLQYKMSIVQDVSFGLLHLHSLNPPIIHRDLTAFNVLLTDGMKAKIADLGVSKIFDIQWLHTRSGPTIQPGTPAYMPPEALARMPSYDLKFDIFSFGALMLHTATQEFPAVYELGADEITEDAIKNHTIQILKRKCWIDKMGEEHPFRSIVMQCLQDRPEARPAAKVLSESICSLCSKYKEEWKNILEFRSQLQFSMSQLQSQIEQQNIELQKSEEHRKQTEKSLMDCYCHTVLGGGRKGFLKPPIYTASSFASYSGGGLFSQQQEQQPGGLQGAGLGSPKEQIGAQQGQVFCSPQPLFGARPTFSNPLSFGGGPTGLDQSIFLSTPIFGGQGSSSGGGSSNPFTSVAPDMPSSGTLAQSKGRGLEELRHQRL